MYFGDGRPIDRAALERMGAAIVHRGPDSEGLRVESGPPSVGLVSRRLAVIDVDGGGQPMTVADGAFSIVYNGELFNAGELRRELEAAGHRFRTRCDTEIVVRGYEQWGSGVLDRMLGMWAFCVWDRDARTLFLARDRLGVKPLVYAQVGGGLVFASEIKALVASGLVERRLDPQRAAALPLRVRGPRALHTRRRGPPPAVGARAGGAPRRHPRVPLLGLRRRRGGGPGGRELSRRGRRPAPGRRGATARQRRARGRAAVRRHRLTTDRHVRGAGEAGRTHLHARLRRSRGRRAPRRASASRAVWTPTTARP